MTLPARAASETADVQTTVRDGHLVVADLRWDSSLRAAGISEGDRITSVGPLRGDPARLRLALMEAEVGAPLRLGIQRFRPATPGRAGRFESEERLFITRPLHPDVVLRVGALDLAEAATPRQLHLREALRTGHRRPTP